MGVVRSISAMVLLLCLGGCSVRQAIVVRPDGSGTVQLVVMVPPDVAAGAGMTVSEMLPNAADWEGLTQRMSGVRLVSLEPVTGQQGLAGTRTVLAFDDINRLALGPETLLGPDVAAQLPGGVPAAPLTFSLTRTGDASQLTVTMGDQTQKQDDDDDLPTMTNPNLLETVRPLIERVSFEMTIGVEGTIVETNADHRSGSTITLVAFDAATYLAAVMKDPEQSARLDEAAKRARTLAETKQILDGLPGILMNHPIVTVTFR